MAVVASTKPSCPGFLITEPMRCQDDQPEEEAMALMQFLRLRRGVSEVVHTFNFRGDVRALLAEGARLVREGRWPAGADSLRAVDEYGRTLMTWNIRDNADLPN